MKISNGVNKKISFPIAIVIIVVCAVLVGVIIWQCGLFSEIPWGKVPFLKKPIKYSECSSHYTVPCYQDSEIIKENIPCSSDEDCGQNNMVEYCKPGFPDVLRCIGAKYYCGDDGFCKGCDCPI